MDRDRRTFLKSAGAAGGVALVGGTRPFAPDAVAAAAEPASGGGDLPRQSTFVTIRHGAVLSLGVKTERGILDVRRAVTALRMRAPATIEDLLHGRWGGAAALAKLVERAADAKPGPTLFAAESSVDLGPCVSRPEKILCVGLNYRRHAAEVGQPLPEVPILFNKYNTALSGHRGVVNVSHQPAEKFDYEVELVVVIGRTARGVSHADALSHVFGYCVGNDLTARDLQLRTSQWMLGKSLDGFGPIGPYLVTADQVPDPSNLKIECRVNGEVRQSSNTSDMIFDCAALVAYISKHFTLSPGDVIFTGTPEGVIAGYPKDRQVWLKPGDRIQSTIERLGEQVVTLG